MPDLVTCLRDHALLTNVTGGYALDRPTLSGQAADEIERLRAEVAFLKENARQAQEARANAIKTVWPQDF